MAIHNLTRQFNYFFTRLNPSPTFEQQAQSEHTTICSLIENPRGPASGLSPTCFLQGSYRQDTAIYSINDVDIVVLCKLWQPGSGEAGTRTYDRDEIFSTIAAPLLVDGRYRDKVYYSHNSMCIKVDLGIKIEILPVVYKAGNYDITNEPFRLYRPENGQWEDGYARNHQQLLTWKNSAARTGSNFKPMVKIMKHLRSVIGLNTVSFHIECLLYSIPDNQYIGNPAEYITNIMNYLAYLSADEWYKISIMTPCGERNIFTPNEWKLDDWRSFHRFVKLWAEGATHASNTSDINTAIEFWQIILGKDFFPKQVSS